jgi:hypothetical protein
LPSWNKAWCSFRSSANPCQNWFSWRRAGLTFLRPLSRHQQVIVLNKCRIPIFSQLGTPRDMSFGGITDQNNPFWFILMAPRFLQLCIRAKVASAIASNVEESNKS